ncbi:MAG TPA: sigma factor-like helix-turn-helix DNA-binding protein, partial [Candidatus Omnitrophota bacterium]|nr:sigma factor-like helix-turn-helix DNA-binding protein [Candidatus Omnitrophota bacterium]
IRLPNYAHDLLKKINAAIEQVFKDTGKEPTTERISELTGIPVKHVIEVRAASRSLTMPTSGNSRGEWENLAKWLGDSKTLSPDWRMRLQDEEAEKGLALRLIQELEPQRRLITKLRNGIGTEEGKTYTLREISEILGSARENGLTRERVRQLEEKAIERLRERMENEERPASVSVIDHTDVFLFETLKLSPRHDDYELFYNLGKDELKRRIESLKEKDTKLAELQKDPYLLLSVETADMPAGARLSEDTIQFQDGTPIVRIQRAASSRPALVGVRSGAVGREIQGALGDRKDIEIVHLYPHSKPEDMLKQFDAVSGSLDASFGIIVDDEDLNADSKKEFLKRFHALDLRSRPVLAGLLNGTTRIQDLTEAEKKDLVTVLSDILPAIAPRSWSKTETRHESAEELWFDMKLQLFHPSFGSSIGELPGFADRSPRAAVWSLDAILKDPLILRTLQDRDRKLSGRMRIDDYLLSDTIDEEELEKRLVAVLGERTAESLMIRFADRLIQTGEVAAVVARKLQSKQGYKPEYILFVDTDAKRSVLRAKGEAYQALYLRGEYALTLDKVATQILAAGTGAKNLFIKGLQMDGEGNFIFTPILPIDFERHFKDFYQSLKQILQAA